MKSKIINQFKSAINSVSLLEEEAWNTMEQYMNSQVLRKHEHIWKKNEVCRHLVFVSSGLFRNYYLSNEKQITLRFFKENSLLLSYKSFVMQQPSDIAFEALEESEIITVPRAAIYDLYDKFKSVDRLGRIMAERSFVEIENLRDFNTLTPEEKYVRIVQEQPYIIERVSQNYISSYLGMTPEHFSRTRNKAEK